MLFCPSFAPCREIVFKSDAVIWWAAIFRSWSLLRGACARKGLQLSRVTQTHCLASLAHPLSMHLHSLHNARNESLVWVGGKPPAHLQPALATRRLLLAEKRFDKEPSITTAVPGEGAMPSATSSACSHAIRLRPGDDTFNEPKSAGAAMLSSLTASDGRQAIQTFHPRPPQSVGRDSLPTGSDTLRVVMIQSCSKPASDTTLHRDEAAHTSGSLTATQGGWSMLGR